MDRIFHGHGRRAARRRPTGCRYFFYGRERMLSPLWYCQSNEIGLQPPIKIASIKRSGRGDSWNLSEQPHRSTKECVQLWPCESLGLPNITEALRHVDTASIPELHRIEAGQENPGLGGVRG